jgi:hypothetical protein
MYISIITANKELVMDIEYVKCDCCGTSVLSGDIRYVEHNGNEVCEYCYDTEMEE